MKYSMNMYPKRVVNVKFEGYTFDILLKGKLTSDVHEKFSIYSFNVVGLDSGLCANLEAQIGVLSVSKLNGMKNGTYKQISTLTYRPIVNPAEEESKYDSDFDDL